MRSISSLSFWSLLLAGSMTLCHAQEFAKVRELSPEETQGKISIILKVVSGRVEWFCNYGKINIQNQPMVVIAKHCAVDMDDSDTRDSIDYIITPNLSRLFENRWIDVRFVSPYTPVVRDRSVHDDKTIVWKQVTINSCIPGSGMAMQCWEIKGDAHESRIFGQNMVKINNANYARILKSGDRRGGAVTGMSWNIVLDTEGRVFWVISKATVYKSSLPYHIISFEALRRSELEWKSIIIPK